MDSLHETEARLARQKDRDLIDFDPAFKAQVEEAKAAFLRDKVFDAGGERLLKSEKARLLRMAEAGQLVDARLHMRLAQGLSVMVEYYRASDMTDIEIAQARAWNEFVYLDHRKVYPHALPKVKLLTQVHQPTAAEREANERLRAGFGMCPQIEDKAYAAKMEPWNLHLKD